MWWRQVQMQVQEMLGEGGQGCVFKALRLDRQTQLSQTVAVKILHSKTAVRLWSQEFESLHRVRSPYCVQVLSFERMRGRPALILEYVDGVSLTELGRTCDLDEIEISEIIAQIHSGLRDLHAQGSFHGDLSPHNVMIDATGRVRLLDFGLANGGGANLRLTPEFAAPERLGGQSATFASDLFSLGRVEQFLRGHDLNAAVNSVGGSFGNLAESSIVANALLHTNPVARVAVQDSPRVEHQRRLAARVHKLRERRRRAALLHTRTQAKPEPVANSTSRKGMVLASIMCCLTLVLTSRASQSTRVALGALTVRTNAWHYLVVDGVPAGYAPLTIPLSAGIPHRLQWYSARAKGEKPLRVGADQQIELSDRDFSH